MEVRADEPRPGTAAHPRVQSGDVHRGKHQYALLVDDAAQRLQRAQRVGQMLEHVEHRHRVRAAGLSVEVLDRSLAEVDAEPLDALLDGPLRRLDPAGFPAVLPDHVEEEAHVRARPRAVGGLGRRTPSIASAIQLKSSRRPASSTRYSSSTTLLYPSMMSSWVIVGTAETIPQRRHWTMSSWLDRALVVHANSLTGTSPCAVARYTSTCFDVAAQRAGAFDRRAVAEQRAAGVS